MSAEMEERTAAVLMLYDALGRHVRDSQVALIVESTARIPLPWLRKGCSDLAQSWDESQRNPGAPAIFRAACRAAGFRPIAAREDYIDPTPDRVRWWPPPGVRAPEAIASRWNHSPLLVQRALPSGNHVLLPAESRRRPERRSPR